MIRYLYFTRPLLFAKGRAAPDYHFRDTSGQSLGFFSSFFSSTSFSSSFRTLCKIRHKTRMRTPIGLNIGTLNRLIKANLSTKFGRNPMNIHGVMADYLRKIRSKVCHAHRKKCHTYLGVAIDNTMSWSSHIQTVSNRATKVLNFIKRNLNNCPSDTKRTAYLTLVRPIMEYAAQFGIRFITLTFIS